VFPFSQVMPVILLKMLTMFVHPIFWLVVGLVGLQYKRMAAVKENMFGIQAGGGVWRDVAVATIFGLAGGVLGSVLMVVIGLTLTESGLMYLWPVAILLMLINARFLCFAYAGGILALGKLLFGFPPVNISQVLALVAILHMVESLLILFSGHLGAVPAYFKDRRGKVVGGFTLQKFWPIPIVALAIMGASGAAGQGIQMPEWWPLLKPGVEGDPDTLVYAMIAVVAGLGYGDLAIARNPREKSKLSAVFLAVYSIILLFLAVAADNSGFMALVAALFSPLGHEAVIYLGRKLEFTQEPLYAPHPDGLRVLDVVPGTKAWHAGIRSGDILVAVNNIPVQTRSQFEYALSFWTGTVELGYISEQEGAYKRELVPSPTPGQPFGLLPIPEGHESNYLPLETAGPLGRWWGEFWQRISGEK